MAARNLTAGMQTEVQASVLRPVIFAEAEFGASGSPDSQHLRIWSGIGEITWDGKIWTGSGNLLTLSPLEESARVEATGFRIGLSGLPSTNIALALSSIRQGRPCKVWLGALNSSGAVIADPYQAQAGQIDTAEIDDAGETCTVSLVVESRLIGLFRPLIRRYTHEDQQIDYPGDLGFEYVAGLQDKQLVWGGPAPVSSVPGDDGPVGGGDGGSGRRPGGWRPSSGE